MSDSRHAAAPIYFDGHVVGTVHRLPDQGRLSFRYSNYWRSQPDVWPLSQSLPLDQAVHTDGRRQHERFVSNFLWGLLPDNELVITRWARHFGVSPNNPLALLCEIGEDCPGGIAFVEPYRAGQDRLLDESTIALELKRLQMLQPSALEGDNGQFSLAGAQAKTALSRSVAGWSLPSGKRGSTHILKPAMPGLLDQAVNEHYCLELARDCGLTAARSELLVFDDVQVLAVERFDRPDGYRLHQEDFCQALGVHPSRKYQSDGGPRIVDMMRLLDSQSVAPTEDQMQLFQAIIFNLIIAGTDAHAKNFGLIYPPVGGKPRLAPLYDLNSMYPYATTRRDLRSSLRIGRHYRITDIQRRHLMKPLEGSRLTVSDGNDAATALLELAPRRAEHVADRFRRDGIHSDILQMVVDGIERTCKRWLQQTVR